MACDNTFTVSKAWELGGLIEEALEPRMSSKNSRVGFVQLGYEIIDALQEGVASKRYGSCIRKIEAITKQSTKIITDQFQDNTRAAVDIARQFGASDAAIILKRSLNQPVDFEEETLIIDKKQLQLHISQEIAAIISGQFDINLLLETVLEGIQRGIGMDRTVFSMLVADKQSLKEKLSLGWRKAVFEHQIVFNISEAPLNLFGHALSGSQAFWAKPAVNAKLYTLRDINVVGKTECFMMPILSNKTPIGLIYTDRGISGESLTQEDFDAFKYFSQQVNIGLTIYRMQRS